MGTFILKSMQCGRVLSRELGMKRSIFDNDYSIKCGEQIGSNLGNYVILCNHHKIEILFETRTTFYGNYI